MNIEEIKQHIENNPEVAENNFSRINVLQVQKNKGKQKFFYQFPNYFTVVHIFSGSGKIMMDNQTHLLKEGGIFLINVDTSFEILNEFNGLISLLLISESYLIDKIIHKIENKSELLFHFRNDKTKNYIHFNTMLMEDPSYIIDRILCEYYDSWSLSNVLVESLLVSLAVELDRFYRRQIIKKKELTSVDSFMAYIKRNYRDNTLEQMAVYFNYHPNYLSARLKQETGKSYLELIQKQRLKVAKDLLENSTLSVEQIAQECGYSSSSFFYKKFKESCKMTPSKFRESLK